MAILTPVEAKKVLSQQHVLRLVDAQVVHFDDFVADGREPMRVEGVKLDIEDALMAVFLNLWLGGPRGARIAEKKTVSGGGKQVCAGLWQPAEGVDIVGDLRKAYFLFCDRLWVHSVVHATE